MSKRNVNIQILRIVSMFFILFCHCKLPFSVGTFLSVGVYTFIMISAYLYGKKDIKNPRKWIIHKFIQICLPVYIWIVVVNILYVITKSNVNYFDNIIYILNLQVFIKNSLLGLPHLWFVSIILIAYLITPLLNKVKYTLPYMPVFIISIIIDLFIAYFISSALAVRLFHIVTYIMVYLYSAREDYKSIKKRSNYLKPISAIILAGGGRILLRKFFDGTIFYSNIVVVIAYLIIAGSIFKIIMQINFKKLNMKIINYLDGISYYVYIVHYIFCVGPVMIVNNFSIKWPLEVLITLVLTFVIATMLKYVTDKITKKLV